MNKTLYGLLALALGLTGFPAFGQDQPEMADKLRSEGKIYVVVAMILIVLAGLIVYLIVIDRKISRLEKRMPGRLSDKTDSSR
jgi:hypothetical protein